MRKYGAFNFKTFKKGMLGGWTYMEDYGCNILEKFTLIFVKSGWFPSLSFIQFVPIWLMCDQFDKVKSVGAISFLRFFFKKESLHLLPKSCRCYWLRQELSELYPAPGDILYVFGNSGFLQKQYSICRFLIISVLATFLKYKTI